MAERDVHRKSEENTGESERYQSQPENHPREGNQATILKNQGLLKKIVVNQEKNLALLKK